MDDNTLENFYHACLYDPSHRVEGIATVNRIKAKIVKLYSALDNRVVKSRHAAEWTDIPRPPNKTVGAADNYQGAGSGQWHVDDDGYCKRI